MKGAFAGLGLLAAAACVAPQPVDVGRAAFQENCATCHGERATGDGRMAVFVPGGVPNLAAVVVREAQAHPHRVHVAHVAEGA